MIERRIINGKAATVSYFDANFEPCAPTGDHSAKVTFDDGDVLVLHHSEPAPDPHARIKHIAVWNRAIAMIDRSEVVIRDLIERELSGIAGISGIRYGDAMKAADRVSVKVAAIRKRAIQRAFRLIRDHGGVA